MQQERGKRAVSESIASSHSESENDGYGDAASQASSATTIRDEPALPLLVLNLQPPPQVPSSVGDGSLRTMFRGQYIGQLSWHGGADLSGIDLGSTNPISLPARLIVRHGESRAVTALQTPTNNANNERLQTVASASGSPATPSNEIEYYARAMTEPEGMTKEESDTCLSCIRGKRRCKGTQLVMVRGTKRCQTCANPGTNTSSRICYFRDPERGIHTFEDGQRVLGPSYGGRRLEKNTRAGRLARREEAAAGGVDQGAEPQANDLEEDETESEEEHNIKMEQES